ncbi:MAG: hypothetical protein HYT80_03965 [Euryarchaeota archaeon]|nr:hypothetical protein [Euryarchaeota archaeon]
MDQTRALAVTALLLTIIVSACVGGAPRAAGTPPAADGAELRFETLRHHVNGSVPQAVSVCNVVCPAVGVYRAPLNVTNGTILGLRYHLSWDSAAPPLCTHLQLSVNQYTKVEGGRYGRPLITAAGASVLRDVRENLRIVMDANTSIEFTVGHRPNAPADYYASLYHNPAIQFRLIWDVQWRETVPADAAPPMPPTNNPRPAQSLPIPAPRPYAPVCPPFILAEDA